MKFTESDKISDPRFAAIQNDPRFIRPRRKQTKVQLDSRFRHLLDSKEFEFVQKVDKYGRPAQLSRERVDLKKFYRADNEDTEERKNISDIQVEEESDREKTGSESESSDGEEGFMDFARGKIAVSSSSDEDQGKSDEDDDAKLNKGSVADSQSGSNDDYQVGSDESEEEEDVIPLSGGRGDDGADGEGEEEVDAGIILQKENVPMGDETRRFAVVNMDWDVVKAGDLMKLFDAFKPATGVIHSVKIYPSEFGKERMAIEDRQGPPAEIFNGPNRSSSPDSDNSSEDDDEDAAAGADTQQVIKDILASSDSKVEFNQTALRRYQLERLRYFYAVVDCDSLRTAKSIYDQCDGSEYESSAVFLDLRYIPDHVQFDEEMPRDTATRVPANYQPKGFVTTALQHSRVKLTWDEDDPERLMVTRRKFTKDDLKEMDFKAYLASDIDDEDDEDISADDEAGDSSKTESMRAKYRALLNGGADSQSDKEAGDSQKDEEYEDMEITFAPGLSNLANKLLQAKREKSMQQNETVFETYLREKREKRKLNKKAKKAEENEPLVSEDERDIKAVANDDFFKDAFNGPEFNNGNAEAAEKTTAGGHKKSKDAPKRTKKRKGGDDDDELVDPDLELLFMDETERQRKHFDMDDIVKTGKKKAKKQKEEKENNDEFDINVSDDRFKALFESAEYAIDPTSAKFKKTKAMDKLLQERRERNADRSNRIKRDERVVNDPSKEQHSPSHLQSMVERIKQNASAVKKGKRTK